MLDTDELRRRYRGDCAECKGSGYCLTAFRHCDRCDGSGTVTTMPRDVQLLCEEVERLQTLLNEGDREGEGIECPAPPARHPPTFWFKPPFSLEYRYQDCTERGTAATLEEAREALRSLMKDSFNNSTIMMTIYDAEGCIVDTNYETDGTGRRKTAP